jgi:hypothetical protein
VSESKDWSIPVVGDTSAPDYAAWDTFSEEWWGLLYDFAGDGWGAARIAFSAGYRAGHNAALTTRAPAGA